METVCDSFVSYEMERAIHVFVINLQSMALKLPSMAITCRYQWYRHSRRAQLATTEKESRIVVSLMVT